MSQTHRWMDRRHLGIQDQSFWLYWRYLQPLCRDIYWIPLPELVYFVLLILNLHVVVESFNVDIKVKDWSENWAINPNLQCADCWGLVRVGGWHWPTLSSGLSYFLAAFFRPGTVNKCGTFVKPLIKTTEITLSEHRKPLRGAGFNIFFLPL